MAQISAVLKTSGGVSTDVTSITTDSFNPSPNRLLLLALTVALNDPSGAQVPPLNMTVTGLGLTWTRVDYIGAYPDTDPTKFWIHNAIYKAIGPSPSTGAVSVTLPSGLTATSAAWSVTEFENADDVAQVVKGSAYGTTDTTMWLDPFSHADNATFSFIGGAQEAGGAATFTPGTGFTELTDAHYDFSLHHTQFKNSNDTSAESTASVPIVWGGFGVEITATQAAVSGDLEGDMTLAHEAPPHGIDPAWDWGTGPRVGVGTAFPAGLTDPHCVVWGIIASEDLVAPVANTRIQVRRMVLDVKRNGVWSRIAYATDEFDIVGDLYTDYKANTTAPANKRGHGLDGLSVKLPDTGGSFHFFTAERFPVASGAEEIVLQYEARLILDDPTGTDNRAAAKILANCGGDVWKDRTIEWNGVDSNYDIAIGRFRYVTSEWQTYYAHTLSGATELQDYSGKNSAIVSWTEADDTVALIGTVGTVASNPSPNPAPSDDLSYAITGGSADLIYSNIPENDHPIYSSTTSYGLNATVISLATHRIYQSISDNNLGNPLTDITKWLDIGATNRWKMHDTSLQSRTESVTAIHHQYRAHGLCTAVAAMNMNATHMSVRMMDDVEGIVYSKSVVLVAGAEITNWYDYFFKQVLLYATDKVFDDLPAYPNAVVDVIIESTSGQAACGELILGQIMDVGATQYGAKVGITDYSTKTQDQFGNYTIVERPYRKTAEFQVMVDNTDIDLLQAILAKYRASPVLYLGSDAYSATKVYGFYRSFDITIAYPTASLCSLSLEGLI